MPYPLCQHIMSSGWHCCSPALTGRTHCYYHDSLSRMLPKPVPDWQCYRNQAGDRLARIPIPLLEDASSLQTAYMQIVYGVLSGELDLARSRVVLSALKAAARNLSEVKREQSIVADVAQEAASGHDVPDASNSAGKSGQELETEEAPLSYQELKQPIEEQKARIAEYRDLGTDDPPPRKRAASAAPEDGMAVRDLAGD